MTTLPRDQGNVSATGVLSVSEVDTFDEPQVSAAGVLSVGTREAPERDRTFVTADGTLTTVKGGGVAVAPSAFTAGQWTATVTGVSGVVAIAVSALPSGTPFTDIEYNTGSGWVSSGLTSTGSFDILGLTDGVSYDIKIRAVNATGNGPDSDTKSRTPTGVSVPAQFGGSDWSIADRNTVDGATITITALPSDGGSAITALEYQVGAGSWTSLGGTSTGAYNISGLTYNTSAAVGIRAVNAVGNGTGSATKNVTPTGSAEADAVFAAFSTPPSSARAKLIDTFIAALKTASIWTKIDALYVMAAADSQAAGINWKAPGTFNLSLVDAPTFTTDRGYTTDGVNDALNTGFTPSTAGGVYTQNSAHMSLRSRTASKQDKVDMGVATGNQTVLIVRGAFNLDECGGRVNATSTLFRATNTDGVGLFHINRSASGANQFYKNGSALTASTGDTTGSTGLPSSAIRIGVGNGGSGWAAREYSSASIGSSLSAIESAAYAAAELAYMQAIGAA